MERLKRVIHCAVLQKNVLATYFIKVIKDPNGIVKTKAIEFFNCDGKKQCEDKYHVLDCTCFKEMKHVEHDINLNDRL